MSELYGLLYYSFADPELDTVVLRFIADRASARNEKKGVTGQLHFENGLFLQWIEGTQEALTEVFDHIERDPHHSGIDVMFFGPIPSRSFGGWHMALSTADNVSLLSYMQDQKIELRDRNRVVVTRLVKFLSTAKTALLQHSQNTTAVMLDKLISLDDHVVPYARGLARAG